MNRGKNATVNIVNLATPTKMGFLGGGLCVGGPTQWILEGFEIAF